MMLQEEDNMAKRLFVVFAAFVVLLSGFSSRSDAEGEWVLVWSDEFDGASGAGPDQTKWNFDIGGGGWGNNELQSYTSRTQNAFLDGEGNLVIKAINERFSGPDRIARNYTSARLLTKGKFTIKFGRLEARLKIPFGQGIWPAFWMLGNDIDSAGWPTCGEIDIMENIGREPSIAHSTLHGPGYSGASPLTGSFTLPGGQRYTDDFHVFVVEWETDEIRFFMDGNLYHTRKTSDIPAGRRWVYDHPFFIIMNVAVGGNWPGSPDASTTFPQSMLVDYVRVYSDEDRASLRPAITSAVVKKKDVIVSGENFDRESIIMLNNEDQTTKFDSKNASLIGKKLLKKIKKLPSGIEARIQVRNSNGVISNVTVVPVT
jgi:beta-glucanase (GH16 family)